MAETAVEKKPKKRARRNYAKEMEKLQTYLETVIRIYSNDDEPNEFMKGELKAYRDCLDYIGGAK